MSLMDFGGLDALIYYYTSYTCKLTVSGPGWNGNPNRPADNEHYHLPHIYILPPDDGLLIRPKHVEVW
jgi:hypothetical protein